MSRFIFIFGNVQSSGVGVRNFDKYIMQDEEQAITPHLNKKSHREYQKTFIILPLNHQHTLQRTQVARLVLMLYP